MMFNRPKILLTLTVAIFVTIAGLALAQIPTPTPIPAAGTPLAAPTTYYLTTAVPSPTPGCPAPLAMAPGFTAYVRGGIYVRTQPSASSPWVNYYQEAVAVTIVDGPVCDGFHYNWWQVRGPGNDGWVAEGVPGGYFMRAGPGPAGTVCGDSQALTPGETVVLLGDVRVRQTPTEDGLVLTVAPAGARAEVLEGPACAGDLNRWRIRVTVLDVVYEGWAAESEPGRLLLFSQDALNAPVCAPPMALTVGTRAYVDYEDQKPKSLRAGPGQSFELIATLLDGIGLEIIGGPVCAEGYNWWQVRIVPRPDVTGWLAEGGSQGDWITPLRDDLNPSDISPSSYRRPTAVPTPTTP